ncbi:MULTISPECIES: hypothetical protein [Heyndrickxia]|uniref:hypothetical protein n=1 Tax=Heyndrickxia TaxID=2837504 RepID=UPI002E21C364|nr:hypothetical protein [Heyndrickxia coagulans]
MNQTKKHIIRQKIGRLLDTRCRNCPHNNEEHSAACIGCSVYEELRELGNQLIPGAKVSGQAKAKKYDFKGMSVPTYVNYKNKGLRDKDIAPLVGLSMWMFRMWKRQHREELDDLIKQGVIPRLNKKTEGRMPSGV